jgi:hypothetical protein
MLERKGHGVNREVTVKGGRGGSRVDIAPDPKAPQTLPRTLESKSVDLNNYRTQTGALNESALRTGIEEDVRQVLKHETALREARKADLPFRETLVYTVENAKPGEAEAFRNLVRRTARKRAATAVLVKQGTLIKTLSGRAVGRITGEVRAGLGLRGLGGAALFILDLATTEPPANHPENILLAPFELAANVVQGVLDALGAETREEEDGGTEGAGPGSSGGAGGGSNN